MSRTAMPASLSLTSMFTAFLSDTDDNFSSASSRISSLGRLEICLSISTRIRSDKFKSFTRMDGAMSTA